MTREELKKEILSIIPESKLISCSQTIIKKYPLIHEQILEKTSYILENKKITFNERLYHIIYHMDSIPTCKLCEIPVRYNNYKLGYSTYCSGNCRYDDPEVQKKRESTNLKKYGVKSIAHVQSIRQKTKSTNLKKYGVENVSSAKEIKVKKEETNFKNHGVKHTFQIDSVKQKIKETNNRKYGVDNPMQNEEIKNKTLSTMIEKYDGIGLSSKIISKRIREGMVKNHGVEHPIQNFEINLKRIRTYFLNYHVSHPMKSKEIQRKLKNTMLEKYGVEFSMQYLKFKNMVLESHRKRSLLILQKNLKLKNIRLVDEFIKMDHIYNFYCNSCESSFQTRAFNINPGFLCPSCYPVKKGVSKPEIELLEFIKDILPNEEIIHGTRKIVPPKEIDIYIPSKDIAIEFNGLYWHSEEMMGEDAKKYHLNKTEECKKQGIQLIHIFEDEWVLKQDIVKSKLKNLLKIPSENNISFKECKIREIDPKTKNEFLNNNHIQGETESSINLGAFYKDSLISAMTFSKENNVNVWKLNRFCSKLNYHIKGIADKLLSHFKKNYKWEEIFSYTDRRWDIGNLYEKLGFKLSHIIQPNYWYVKGMQRINRFNLRKYSEEGCLKIWDCGNLKFKIIHKNKIIYQEL